MVGDVLRKSAMLMDNIRWCLSLSVGDYNVRPPCQLISQPGQAPPGVWQPDSLTGHQASQPAQSASPVFIMFYILTRPSPHYSLKCKSSRAPNMEEEHGLNRWLGGYIFILVISLSYISIIQSHQPTPLSGRMTVYNPRWGWGYYMCY